jgi:phosphoribosylaminoimidazole-succinocarboxamide synthase
MSTAAVYLGREPRIGGLQLVSSGKVRDIYALDERHLLFVTSDRISAFDVLMQEGVPNKGRVLTAIAAWWFEQTRDLVPNHLVSTAVDDVPRLDARAKEKLRGRVMIVRRAQPTSVEWVVRAYLSGSGWKEYKRSGRLFDLPLPRGLRESDRLPAPVLTPTTKDAQHDLPLSAQQAAERVGAQVFEQAQRAALALFARGSALLAERGLILADTKFEFGLEGDRLLLIDEALTPDSSRLWPADDYEPGRAQVSYDKQILRDWLEAQPWNKEPPPPRVDPAVLDRLASRYLELCQRVTGAPPPGVAS